MRALSPIGRWRAYAYGLVTTALVLVFALAESETERYVTDRSRLAGRTIEITILLLAALAFRPLHRRIELLIEAAFTKRRREAREALSHLQKELTSFRDVQQVLRRLVEAVDRHMSAGGCAIYLRRGMYVAEASSFDVPLANVEPDDALVTRLRSAAVAADPRSLHSVAHGELAFSMMAGGELIGFLTLTPKRIEYDAEDRHAIAALAEAAGLALIAVDPRLRPLDLRPWLVPDTQRTPYFTGRDELLERLRQQLGESNRAALCGLGGIGKTQTALEYAVRHRADYPAGVFWINAESTGGLISGFVAIAAALRLPAAESNDHEDIVTAVLEWFNGNDGWLLILDNVEDRREVRRFVPQHEGHVLITSREPVFGELGIPHGIEVGDFDPEAAVRFLLRRTGHDDAMPEVRASAAELAAELGNLPLALEQAAAYMAETSAFSAYIHAFRTRRLTLLEKSGGLVSHETVAVTWAANFEAVQRESPAAADVLRVSALCGANAIPFELFLDGARSLGDSIAAALSDPDDLTMAEVLRPLTRYSLVRSDSALRAFSVHRLVQEIVWLAVPESERPIYVARAVCAFDAAFPEVEYAHWAQCERFVPHIAALCGWLDSYDAQPEAASRVLGRAGQYLLQRGRYAEAQRLHEYALSLGERALGPNHPIVATSLNLLALVHWHQSRYDEARTLNERALVIRENALGSDHPEVASILNALAVIHSNQGRYAQAEALYERALAIRERAFGPDHRDVARTLINLANQYCEQGRYDESRALYERALKIWERELGPDHPDVAGGLTNLAGVLVDLGRYAEALPLFERALAIRERALEPDHPDVAYGLNGLANAFLQLGRCDEAEPLYERALALRERALMPDHADLAESLLGLANVYVRQHRYAEAEPLYERALAIRERAGGPDHPKTVFPLVGLAALRAEQGRTTEAIALYERALDIGSKTFAGDHPQLAQLRANVDALRTSLPHPGAAQAY